MMMRTQIIIPLNVTVTVVVRFVSTSSTSSATAATTTIYLVTGALITLLFAFHHFSSTADALHVVRILM